jgi:PPM family protein phosphatase
MTLLQIDGQARVLGFLCRPGPDQSMNPVGCALAEWEIPVLLGIAITAIIGTWLVRRHRDRARMHQGSSERIPLVFPVASRAALIRNAGQVERKQPRSGLPSDSSGPPPAEPTPRTPNAGGAPPPPPPAPPTSATQESAPQEVSQPELTPEERFRLKSTWPPPDLTAQHDPQPASEPPPAGAGNGHPQSPPPDGTLQLLPGRLEIVSEPPPGQPREIRFVRVPGTPPEITFGRSEGEPFRHVRLDSPTVSRLHARLRFAGGRWTLVNESSTNPTQYNGRPLGGAEDATMLADGDRIEMGDVSLRFHQPDAKDRLAFRSSWFTDQGRRPSNQDAVAVRTLTNGSELLAICDGMGSHTGGEIASHRAIEALIGALEEGVSLVDATRVANEAVLTALGDEADTVGAGTTLVALLRTGALYEVVNVGDSRAYRLGTDTLEQISQDHSFVAEVVRDGRMSEEEALRSPWKNAVTRHLGAAPELEIDHFPDHRTDTPHLVLLCSDGVHSSLSPEELESVLRRTPDIRDVAKEVVESALARGSTDNVTAAAIAFGDPR